MFLVLMKINNNYSKSLLFEIIHEGKVKRMNAEAFFKELKNEKHYLLI